MFKKLFNKLFNKNKDYKKYKWFYIYGEPKVGTWRIITPDNEHIKEDF